MAINIDPTRQSYSILPKAALEFDVQDKIIPNGNKVIEIVEEHNRASEQKRVKEIDPTDKISLSTKH